MANEDKKDFNAMLMDSKDMPKFPFTLLSSFLPVQVNICHSQT